MRRKRLLTIGATGILAFMLVLAGCGKAVDEPVSEAKQESINNVSSDEKINKPKITRNGETGELIAKREMQVPYPSDTLEYSGSNFYMAADTDYAETLGLDTSIFTILGYANNAAYTPRLYNNKIRFYSNTTSAANDGSYIDVTVIENYTITSITIDFESGSTYTSVYNDDGVTLITRSGGSYNIGTRKFRIQNGYTGTSGSQVVINSIVISYTGPSVQDLIEDNINTYSSLSYFYTKNETFVTDTIDKTFTGVGGSYTAWSDKTGESAIVYAGYVSGRNNYLNLNSGGSAGVVSTNNNTDFYAKKIVLTWNDATVSGRIIDIYGKDTAYTSASNLYSDETETQGTLLGSLAYNNKDEENKTTLIISASYKFIGIRSRSEALYLDSIDIQWNEPPVYEYSNVAIRFGYMMEQSLWERMDDESTIKGYGVMLSTPGYLGENEIKKWYTNNGLAAVDEDDLDDAIATACGENVGAVKNFYTKITGEKTNPAVATAAQKGALEGDYYIWNLYKNISTEPDNRKTSYTAVAYIRVASGIVFLRQTTASAKSLAADLIDNDVYVDDSFDGSLHELANLA